jgi:hypothetical protein
LQSGIQADVKRSAGWRGALCLPCGRYPCGLPAWAEDRVSLLSTARVATGIVALGIAPRSLNGTAAETCGRRFDTGARRPATPIDGKHRDEDRVARICGRLAN